MSKLTKVNKNGSLSVILPKAITKDVWEEGSEVIIESLGIDAILIERQRLEKQSIDTFFCSMSKTLEEYKKLLSMLKEVTAVKDQVQVNEEMFRKMIKQFLLEQIRRI